MVHIYIHQEIIQDELETVFQNLKRRFTLIHNWSHYKTPINLKL